MRREPTKTLRSLVILSMDWTLLILHSENVFRRIFMVRWMFLRVWPPHSPPSTHPPYQSPSFQPPFSYPLHCTPALSPLPLLLHSPPSSHPLYFEFQGFCKHRNWEKHSSWQWKNDGILSRENNSLFRKSLRTPNYRTPNYYYISSVVVFMKFCAWLTFFWAFWLFVPKKDKQLIPWGHLGLLKFFLLTRLYAGILPKLLRRHNIKVWRAASSKFDPPLQLTPAISSTHPPIGYPSIAHSSTGKPGPITPFIALALPPLQRLLPTPPPPPPQTVTRSPPRPFN